MHTTTVQLPQRSRLPFSWTMPPNSPELNALITRFRESYSSVSMSRESKRLKKSNSNWLNSGNALIQRVKSAIFVFPVLPDSAEAQVIWAGIVKHLLISYFIGRICAKNIFLKSIHVCQSYSKPKVGRFFETRCSYTDWTVILASINNAFHHRVPRLPQICWQNGGLVTDWCYCFQFFHPSHIEMTVHIVLQFSIKIIVEI